MKKIKRLLRELEGVQEATWGWSFEMFSISTIQVRRDGQVIHTNTKRGAIEFLKAEIAKHKPVESWTPKLGDLVMYHFAIVHIIEARDNGDLKVKSKNYNTYWTTISDITKPSAKQIKKAMTPAIGEQCWFWDNGHSGKYSRSYGEQSINGWDNCHPYWITPLSILQQLEKERKK